MQNFVKVHEAIKKIKRLAVKHQRQAENSCNGRGWLNGKFYTMAALDDYELQQHPGALSGYVPGGLEDGRNVFDAAGEQYEEDIKKILPAGFRVEFQGDPRGCTVKLFDEAGQWVKLT